jgi:thiamine-monophosphate kinase
MTTLHELGEQGLIDALAARFADLPEGWLGIGDDAAITNVPPGTKVLTAVDMLVEGIHFRTTTTSPQDLGWKALAVNVSDIAAMGGEPLWAVVGLSAPGSLDAEWVLGFYEGLYEYATATDTQIVGGDTVGSTGPISVSVTVVGAAEPTWLKLRNTAEPGDVVFVTGATGLAAAGLWVIEHAERVALLQAPPDRGYMNAATRAHRRPVPHLDAARAIRESGVRVAMLDNSDGVARSVSLLAEASRVDVRLEVAELPVDAATRAIAAVAGVVPVSWALFGGEDYHLVGSVGPQDFERLARGLRAAGVPCHPIGEVLAGTGALWVRDPDQQLHQLDGVAGFEHFGRGAD